MSDDQCQLLRFSLEVINNYGIPDVSTLLFYRAMQLKYPIKYLVINKDQSMTLNERINTSITLRDAVINLLNSGQSLEQIINILNKFTINDLSILYYLILKDVDGINLDIILEQINTILVKNNFSEIANVELLNINAENWLIELNKLFNKDAELCDQLYEMQKVYIMINSHIVQEPINQIFYTPITWITKTLSIKFDINGTKPLDIFKNSIVSYTMPYIRYIKNWENNEVYTKIYNGKSPDTRPNFNNIIWLPGKTKNEYMYFTVWIEPEGSNIYKINKKSYINGKYDITENTLYITINFSSTTDNVEETNVINNIQRGFNLPIVDVTETSVGGNFKLIANNDLIFDKTTLTYALTNIDEYANYLYLREVDNTLAGTDRFKLQYRNMLIPTDVTNQITLPTGAITPTVKVIDNNDILFEIEDLNGNVTKLGNYLPEGFKYIDINISSASSMQTADNIRKVSRILFALYSNNNIYNFYNQDPTFQMKNRASIANFYLSILPGLSLEPIYNIPKTNENIEDVSISIEDMPSMWKNKVWIPDPADPHKHINALKAVAPDIFGNSNYSRFFKPPIIIKESELDEWLSLDVAGMPGVKNQAFPFPKDSPRFYFACPPNYVYKGKELFFPGVSKVSPSHKLRYNGKPTKYTFLPNCFKDNQKPDNPDQWKKGYYNYYIGITNESNSSNMLDEKKNVKYGRFGKILPQLTNVLSKSNSTIIKPDNFNRLGVVDDNNSLLHCIFTAFYYYYTQVQGVRSDNIYIYYYNLSIEDKIKYIENVRQNLINQTRPELYKQEMYTLRNDEIIEYLTDNTKFFDPSLVFRGMEELFNINLYVFSENLTDNTIYLDMPKFKLTPIRNLNNRFTIIIFKYRGNISNKLRIPKCELVVYKHDNNLLNTIYDVFMSKYLYKLLQSTVISRSWNIIGNPDKEMSRSSVYYDNIYNEISLYKILGGHDKVKYQMIDGMGKQRGFVTNNDVMIIGPPGQPENLPQIEHNLPAAVQNVLQIFNNPIQGIDKHHDKIYGIWYPILQLRFGFYIPIEPIDVSHKYYNYLNQFDIGPRNPIFNDEINYDHLLNKLKHQRDIILSFVYWLFILSGQDKDVDILQDVIPGQITEYDLSLVPESLPVVNNIQEALSYIKGIAPDLIFNGKIYCYSHKFYNDLKYFIKDIHRNTEGLELEVPTIIEQYNANDFRSKVARTNTLIFETYSDFINWNDEINQDLKEYNTVNNEIDLSFALHTGPYIYKNKQGQFYLIQNVVKGSLDRAITVAYNWYLNKINIGFSASEYQGEYNPDHIIYGIATNKTLVPIVKNAGNSNFLRILRYNVTYAAILPL